MSSQLAAKQGTDKKYIQALLKRCRSFGFTPEQVQAFEHPRVVFEIDSQDYSPEHFDKYNQTDKKEQSEEARIVKFSKTVKPNVLRGLADVGIDFTSPENCGAMMNVFIQNGVISQAELPRYFDGNKVSSAGRQFISEYILGGVLNESVIRALYGEGMGNLKSKVIESAYLLLENWANGSYAVIDELNKAIGYAIAFTTDINNKKFVLPKPDKGEKQSPEEKLAANMKAFNVWASQGDLYETKDPVIMKLAGALVFSGPLFKEYLTKLNTATASAAKAERESQESGNSGLFGEDFSPDRSDLLQKAVASWLRRHGVKRNIMSSAVGGVSASVPVQLFSAVKALYDSGRVSRQVVESGFRMVKSSVYTDLHSGGRSRIILSAVKSGFANNDYIMHLRDGILDRLKPTVKSSVTWDFKDSYSKGTGIKKVLTWESSYKYGVINHSVVFKENMRGTLFIFVDGVKIGKVRQGMGSNDFKSKVLIKALGVLNELR